MIRIRNGMHEQRERERERERGIEKRQMNQKTTNSYTKTTLHNTNNINLKKESNTQARKKKKSWHNKPTSSQLAIYMSYTNS